MSREWQQTRYKEFVLPDAVYYQTLWVVRDLDRMKERLRELGEELDKGGTSIVTDTRSPKNFSSPTERKAIERATLEERIKGVTTALNMVPQNYRSYVMSSIVLKNQGYTFPGKIWRIWKQRFLFHVAKNLYLF